MKKRILLCFFIVMGTLSQGWTQYWQQDLQYFIEVNLNVAQKSIEAKQVIEYSNNSPNDLKELYIHVYPNSHSNKKTAFAQQLLENNSLFFQKAPQEDLGKISHLNFQRLDYYNASEGFNDISGASLNWSYTDHQDIIKIDLKDAPLKSGHKIYIYTPFHVQLPKVFSRLGYGDQVMHFTQWHPKPAVYDQNGWHPMPYLDQGEFYGEFATYHVSIQLPKSFTVIATGEVDQVEQQRMRDLAEGKVIESTEGQKNISFYAEKVHDFAWFVSDQWTLDYFLLERENDSSIDVWTASLNPDTWQNVFQAVQHTVDYLDRYVGAYPYPQISIVDGDLSAGAGMEYPMVSLIQKGLKGPLLERVVVHEVGHNWFYGVLANNERANPWMDESINSFYESRVMNQIDPNNQDSMNEHVEKILIRSLSKTRKSQPVNLGSEQYTSLNYGVDLYLKAPKMIHYLSQYLGEEEFNKMMQEYYEAWKFKHPTPEDLKKSWSKSVSKDIDWFFEWMDQAYLGDVKLKKASKGTLKITNQTGIKSFPIGYYNNVDGKHHWVSFEGPDTLISIGTEQKEWSFLDSFLDDNAINNYSSYKWSVRPIGGLNFRNKEMVYALPIIGFNAHDGWMLGIGLHNYSLESKTLEFNLLPFYSFQSKAFTGQGKFQYNIWGDHTFAQQVSVGLKAASYHFWDFERGNNEYFQRFIKIAPYVHIHFKNKNPRSLWKNRLNLQFDFIKEQSFNYNWSDDIGMFVPMERIWVDENYLKLHHNIKYNHPLSPLSIDIKAQGNEKILKMSGEVNWRIPYMYKNQSAKIRAFAGWMWYNKNKYAYLPLKYHWATTYTSNFDFTYEEAFWARNEYTSFAQQQISIHDGGFKTLSAQYHSPIGISNSWLTGLNLSFDIPKVNLPIRVYADLTLYPNKAFVTTIQSSYAIGVEFYASDILSVYFPILLSDDFKDYKKFFLANSYGRTISFKFNLNALNLERFRSLLSN